MRSLEHTPEPEKLGRIAAIDVARGLALLGMGVYHLSWDLAYFGFAPPNVPYTPAMRVCFAYGRGRVPRVGRRVVRDAHTRRPAARAFLRRLAIVAGAASW